MTWPRQDPPLAKIWKFWNNQILCYFSTGHGRLAKPLGPWIRVTKHWTNYWDPMTNTILCNTNNGWTRHIINTEKWRYIECHQDGESCLLTYQLVTITDMHNKQGTRLLMCSVPSSLLLCSKKAAPQTFAQYVSQSPKWERVLLSNIKALSQSYLPLNSHLTLGSQLWLVTNRGVKGSLGYFGWVIAFTTHVLWQGYSQSQGNPDLMESLRAESYGALSILHFLYQ
eukprot:672542-Ditylum_brightwellii.AAC.2